MSVLRPSPTTGQADGIGWLALLLIGVAAVFCGFIASMGSPLLAFFTAALFLAIFLVAFPLALFWVVVVGGLVLAGVSELYFPAFRQARWGVAIASIGLTGASLLSCMAARRAADNLAPRLWSPIATWAILFFLTVIFSALINLGNSFDTLVGLKGYFQVWGLLLAFALLPLRPASVDRSMSFLFWLGLLQFPFILQQHFVLVPQRSGVLDAARGMVAQDILVGTFSGSMTGGGAGAAMAVLLLVAIALTLAMWRVGNLTLMKMSMVLVILLLPLAIGEHKIALVLLPIALFTVFEDKIRKNPLHAIWLMIASAFLVTTFYVAFTRLPQAGTSRPLSPDEYWQEMWAYNVGERGYGNAVLNRTTVYPFWVKYHQTAGGSFINTLVGYGPGSSNDARGGLAVHTLAADRYPGYGIGLTGLSGLLWDVGILGAFAAFGLFLSAFRIVSRLIRQTQFGTSRWANLKGAQAGISMIGLSFLHNNMFLYEIGFQTLTMLLLGYILYVQRTSANMAPGYTGRDSLNG